MNPYENLANAIVVKAAEDYRGSLRVLRCHPDDRNALIEQRRLEAFFRSGWFGTLTNLDGSMLMRKIKSDTRQMEGIA